MVEGTAVFTGERFAHRARGVAVGAVDPHMSLKNARRLQNELSWGAGGGGGRGGGDGSSSIRSSASVRCALPGGGKPKLAPGLDTVAQPPTAGRLPSGRAVSTAERVLLAGGAASSSAASAEALLRTAAAQSLWMRVDAGDAGPSASPRSRATAGSPLTASPPHRPVRGPAPPTAVHLNGDGGQARRLGSSRSPGRPRRAASRRGGEEGSESSPVQLAPVAWPANAHSQRCPRGIRVEIRSADAGRGPLPGKEVAGKI